jgi:hypothetical protein
MPTLEQDLAFVRAGLEELESYLLSDELYWPLSGPVDLPRFTIGGLLLSLKRAQARGRLPAIQTELTARAIALDLVRSKWRSAWERKVRREVHARLDLWKNYLADYRQSPETQSDLFHQQVEWRVLLHLLDGELSRPDKEFSILDDLDKVLKSFWLPGVFAWQTDLQDVFPQGEFWFLYGKLK